MAYIYTISHPITNDIVYVGASKNLIKRSAAHQSSVNTTGVSKYILELKKNYLLPKIEVIDECEDKEMLSLEAYWISQLKAWGFNLLNIHKSRPAKGYIYKKRFNKKTEHRIRKSKKWTLSMFDIGLKYSILESERNVFYTTFRYNAKRFDRNVELSWEKSGSELIGEVVEKRDKVVRPLHITKSGKVNKYIPKPKKAKQPIEKEIKAERYKLNEKKPGDEIIFHKSFLNSFKQSVYDFRKRTGSEVYFNYQLFDKDSIRIAFVKESDIVRKKLPKGTFDSNRNKWITNKKIIVKLKNYSPSYPSPYLYPCT